MEKIMADIVSFLMRLLSKLPLRFHYACCSFLSWCMLHIFHYRKDVVMTNLARSFPEMKYKDLQALCKQFYGHLGDIMTEAIKFAGCTTEQKARDLDICEIEITDEFNRDYEDCSGMMVLTAHCGNWEIYGGILGYVPEGKSLGFGADRICVAYKKLSSAVMNRVFAQNRCAPIGGPDFGGYLESRSILRHAIEHKGEKMVYLFPTDQFPYKGAGRHEIPSFMNQKTYVMTGGATLAHKMGMTVYYLGFESVRRGHYKMTLKPVCKDASSMSVEEIMTKYYEILQQDIQAQPWNYLWSHKRWK